MSSARSGLQAGPALPWAAPVQPPSHDDETSQRLNTGDRIQVRWQIEEDNAETRTKWWGATVLDAAGIASGHTCRIRYDESNGFDSEEVQVELLSSRELCHANDREETLAWKREGSAYEEPEEEGDEAGNAVIALQELTEEQQELERLTGRTIEEEAMQHLSENLQPAQQVEVLSRFKDFTDFFKGQLQELVQEDASRVVTSDDIHNIAQGFSRRQGS